MDRGLVRRRAEVRRRDEAGRAEQRRCLCRLLYEHIQSSARDMARVQRVLERLLVEQAAARAVADAHALLRLGEILAAQGIALAVRDRRVERDDVGKGQKVDERELSEAHFHGDSECGEEIGRASWEERGGKEV